MYKLSSEKRDRMAHKIDKMMDFLEEFKMCLEDAEEADYRGGSYRKEWDEEEPKGRYGYRRGR